MASADARSRARRFNLPTQQRRLRHLRSIAARNIAVRTRPEEADIDISTLDTYLTLHRDKHSTAFFTSEKIRGSLNPTWRSFNLQHVNDPTLDTATSDMVVRVWRGKDDAHRLIMEWHVNLTGLVFIGDKVRQDEFAYKTNTLIFGMFEGYYSQASLQTPGSASLGSVSLGSAGSPDGEPEQLAGLTVETAAVRDSYGVNSLLRIQTVLRAITQTQASVKKVRCGIEEKLSASQDLAAKKKADEMLQLRVNQLRAELQWRTTQLQTEKETHETTQANIHQRDVVLKTKFETLARDKERLHDKKRAYFDVREDLIKTGAQLVMRRKQLISELSLIYPVQELDSGDYTVCGVKLPNSEDFSGQDEVMVAVALGYTTHLVQMINNFLDVPLRYPMEHRGSRSRVTDHIHDKLTDKDRDFPLYSKGKEKFQFNYGVYLLNKNIAQLRYYCGLGTTDLRVTLPNLKSLLELRLGVKFDPATNSLAVTPSQHVPLPPNLGGPQKLTSNFNSRLTPRPELLIPEGKTPSRSESEDSKFEQMLRDTQRCQEEKSTTNDVSPDTSDTSAPHSSSSSQQPTPSDGSVPVGSVLVDSMHVGSMPVEAANSAQETCELFQAAPDAFFEIQVKASLMASVAAASDDVAVMELAEEQLELGQDALTTTSSSSAGFNANFSPHNNHTQQHPEANGPSSAPTASPALQTDPTESHPQPLFIRNKILERPLNDADSDVSSSEENINASYGSKFKVWPQGDSSSYANSDNDQPMYDDEEIDHSEATGAVISRHSRHSSGGSFGNPSHSNHGVNLHGNIGYHGNNSDKMKYDEADFSSAAVSTFKTRAMSSTGAQPNRTVSSHPGMEASFRRTVVPRRDDNLGDDDDDDDDDLPVSGRYGADICERTDALSTNFSSFKVKLPVGSHGNWGPRGILDDTVPSGGESDH